MPAEPGVAGAAPRARIVVGLSCVTAAVLVGWIVFQIPGEVFNSGDGAMKALQARQFAAGPLSVPLELPAAPWVRELWDRGFYPYEPPFVYPTPRGPLSQFPFLFPLLTAPFYAPLGFRGLFLLPALCLFAVWFAVARLARHAGAGEWERAIALAGLALSTPLTLYGAMYYEHTLAVLLQLAAIGVLVLPGSRSRTALLGVGALAGLTPWLRSEAWCLLAAFCALAAWRALRERDLRWLAFHAGAVLTAGGYLLCNRLVYGRWLGMHAAQVVGSIPLHEQLLRGARHLAQSAPEVALYCPAAIFVLAVLAALLLARRPLPPMVPALLSLIVFDLVTVPFVLYSSQSLDWGPRYFLVLAPLLALLTALLLPLVATLRPAWRRSLFALLAVVLAAGFWINCVRGTRELLANYRGRVWPALVELRRSPDPVVVINHQYGAMELESLHGEKAFLLAADAPQLSRLSAELAARGRSRFVFLVFPFVPVPPRVGWSSPAGRTSCAVRAQRGQFLLYDCTTAAL